MCSRGPPRLIEKTCFLYGGKRGSSPPGGASLKEEGFFCPQTGGWGLAPFAPTRGVQNHSEGAKEVLKGPPKGPLKM